MRTAGQLLAEIETPEIDQKLNQASAAGRGESRTGASHLASWDYLLRRKSRLAQEFDEKKAGAVAIPSAHCARLWSKCKLSLPGQ